MLTTKNLPKEEKTKQLISDMALCPFIFFMVNSLYTCYFLFPWNAQVASAPISANHNIAMNTTHFAAHEAWYTAPVGYADDECKEKKWGRVACYQTYFPVVKIELKGEKATVKERADNRQSDLPGAHLRFMIQEQARDDGIYKLGVGVAAVFSIAMKTHYAARAVSGLHLFAAVYLALEAFVFFHQTWVDPDMHYAPYTYRTTAATVWQTGCTLLFGTLSLLNLVAFVGGLQAAGKLTEAARKADESGKTSGLIAGPSGSVEFKNFTGKEKGVQVASAVGICAPAVLFLLPLCFLVLPSAIWSWYDVSAVASRYTGLHGAPCGITQEYKGENATLAWGRQIMINSHSDVFAKQTKTMYCDSYDNSFSPPACITFSESSEPDCKVSMVLETDIKLKKNSAETVAQGCQYGACESSDKYTEYEAQDCKGPNKDLGKQGHAGDNLYMRAFYLVKLHAKLAGAWQTATVVVGIWTLARGTHFAARAMSGMNIGFAVIALLWLLQQFSWAFAPNFNYVPKLWRDSVYTSMPPNVLFHLVMAGANIYATLEGMKKAKEIEGDAKPADADAPNDQGVNAPPQATEGDGNWPNDQGVSQEPKPAETA